MTITTTELELSRIIRDPEIQPREVMDHDTVAQYAEDMLAGITFPPVVVFHDGDCHWLSQGFHRCQAAEDADFESILAEVRRGTRQDALWDAAGSNREHDTSGLRRSNADKQRAVAMAMAHPQAKTLSNVAIAEHCGVGEATIRRWRKSNLVIDEVERRIGLDGRSRSRPSTNGRKPKEQPEPEIEDESESDDELDADPFSLESAPSIISAEVKPAVKPKFNETNEMVDWARWTWNPVTGCEHNCIYCYARDIANRFYPEKFTPTFRPERLDAPRHTCRPTISDSEPDPIKRTAWRNVFVCSMADLFGRWVPDQWINDVFDSCRSSPEWNYLFLTKFPQRYVGLDFPETAWVGTSVDEQKRVANAEKAFSKIDVPVKWLSVEPMREPITFNDLSMFHWVVIGGQSKSTGDIERHPDVKWVVKLMAQAWDSGCKVYLKPNTFLDWEMPVKEYPF